MAVVALFCLEIMRVRISGKSELPPPGETREFDASGKMICVGNSEGEFYAVDNFCLHRGAPLGQAGVVVDGKIVCAWHGWAWDAETGRCALNPEVRIRVYPVTIADDEVFVDV